MTLLPTPNGEPFGQTGGAHFIGPDVYMDGTTSATSQAVSVIATPVYWKNGVVTLVNIGSYIGVSNETIEIGNY